MPRPKLGGASERFQMVISSKELGDIEAWQLANGIASKSEAIRRLCRFALKAMEEPSEAMLNALEAEGSKYVGYEDVPALYGWRLMIRSAIEEAEQERG